MKCTTTSKGSTSRNQTIAILGSPRLTAPTKTRNDTIDWDVYIVMDFYRSHLMGMLGRMLTDEEMRWLGSSSFLKVHEFLGQSPTPK